jgi:hypothetical protein
VLEWATFLSVTLLGWIRVPLQCTYKVSVVLFIISTLLPMRSGPVLRDVITCLTIATINCFSWFSSGKQWILSYPSLMTSCNWYVVVYLEFWCVKWCISEWSTFMSTGAPERFRIPVGVIAVSTRMFQGICSWLEPLILTTNRGTDKHDRNEERAH